MQSSSFCTGFFPLPLNQFPSPQIHSSPSLFCALRGGPRGLLHLDSLAHWLLVVFGQLEALEGNWRAVGKWHQVVFPPRPSHFSAVSDSCYVRSWLQLLLGRLLCMGSSTHWAPPILFPSLGPGEVMAYCCSHFLGVSPSLVCSLNPGHNSVSSPINKVSSFESSGIYPVSCHDFVWHTLSLNKQKTGLGWCSSGRYSS